MHIHHKFWVEKDGEILFGEGRLDLLKALENNGSLAGAARELGMSYRAAWGRLRASEERLGFKLVQPQEGGRRNLELTERARRIMRLYEETFEEMGKHYQKVEQKFIKEMTPGEDEA